MDRAIPDAEAIAAADAVVVADADFTADLAPKEHAAARAPAPTTGQFIFPISSADNHACFLRFGFTVGHKKALPLHSVSPPTALKVQLKPNSTCDECASLHDLLDSRASGLDYATIQVGARNLADHHVATAAWPPLHVAPPPSSPCFKTAEKVFYAKELRGALAAPKPRRPLPHQRAALKMLESRSLGASGDSVGVSRTAPKYILIKFAMGSGKTSLAARALEVLPQTKRNVVVWVCTNTLVAQSVIELQRFSRQEPGTVTEFHVVGYSEFHRLCHDDPRCVEDATVIVDEAHYYRNLSAPMKHDVLCIQRAARVILLTGTPLVNDASEIWGTLALLGLRSPYDDVPEATPTPEDLLALLLHPSVLVLEYDPRLDPVLKQRFPETVRETIRVEMSWLDVLSYKIKGQKNTKFGHVELCTSNTNAYRVASRTGCNTAAKTRAIVDYALEKERQRRLPGMVYSCFREKGLDLVSAELARRAAHLRKAELNGDTPGSVRQEMIDTANDGKVDVQLISEAAGVGTNFKGGFHWLVKMEPPSNEQEGSQVDNRIVRVDATPVLLAAIEAGTLDVPITSKRKVTCGKRRREGVAVADVHSVSATATADADEVADTLQASQHDVSPDVDVKRETVTLAQFVSVFPQHPPTREEARALDAAFESYIPDHGVDIAADLVQYARDEETTVDERMVQQNAVKHAALCGLLDTMVRAARIAKNAFEAREEEAAVAARLEKKAKAQAALALSDAQLGHAAASSMAVTAGSKRRSSDGSKSADALVDRLHQEREHAVKTATVSAATRHARPCIVVGSQKY